MSTIFCSVSGEDNFHVNLCFSIVLLALALSFPSVLVSSFPLTSFLPSSQHDFQLKPSPEPMCKRISVGSLDTVCNPGKLQWLRSRLTERVKLPTQYFSLGAGKDCEATSWLLCKGLLHKVVALKEAESIDTKSRVLPAVCSDAK